MDAVTKAAEALKNLKGFTLIGEAEIRYVAATVLDAVGYDALRTERDEYMSALKTIAGWPGASADVQSAVYFARAALDRETP